MNRRGFLTGLLATSALSATMVGPKETTIVMGGVTYSRRVVIAEFPKGTASGLVMGDIHTWEGPPGNRSVWSVSWSDSTVRIPYPRSPA